MSANLQKKSFKLFKNPEKNNSWADPSHLASSRTRVRIPLRTFLSKEVLARASYYKHVSLGPQGFALGPQDLDRSLGKHGRPYTETRQPIRPKDPAVPRGGKCGNAYRGLGNRSIFYFTVGWVIDRSFTPGSSVGSTITNLDHCIAVSTVCIPFVFV